MAAQRMGFTLGAAIALAIIISAVLLIFFYPTDPSITVDFQITTGAPTSLTVTQRSYAKLSLVDATNIPKGNVTLAVITGNTTTTPYSVTISVMYGFSGTILTPQTTFKPLGDGIYQMRVVYNPRTEQSTTPYLVQFILMQGSFVISTTTITVFPQ